MQDLLQAAGLETTHLRKLECFRGSGIPRILLNRTSRSDVQACKPTSNSKVRLLPLRCISATLYTLTASVAGPRSAPCAETYMHVSCWHTSRRRSP